MYNEVNKMIPIVEKEEINANKAMLLRVSNLFAISRLIILAIISAIAVDEDNKNKFPGRVSR